MVTQAHDKSVILTVDNDSDVRAAIGRALEREGVYDIIEAEDSQTALRLAREYRPELIILDVGLADMNGFELCSHLRAMPFVNHTPILFLSAHQSAQYAAQALDSGGDDYLRKPFATRELNARVRALLRRTSTRQTDSQPLLRLDSGSQSVQINNRRITLTPTEYSLLEYLCRYQDEHHTAYSLLEKLWNYPAGGGDTALVRNHIRNLRRKIEIDADHPTIIVSLHGRGYTVSARVLWNTSRAIHSA
jgi:DNA-binding response OmpR family regulator